MKEQSRNAASELEQHERIALRNFVRTKAKELADARKETRDQLQMLAELDESLSAKDAILLYLKIFENEVVTTQELEIVAGISEYARRIRELVSEGHLIKSDVSKAGTTYVLKSTSSTR